MHKPLAQVEDLLIDRLAEEVANRLALPADPQNPHRAALPKFLSSLPQTGEGRRPVYA